MATTITPKTSRVEPRAAALPYWTGVWLMSA